MERAKPFLADITSFMQARPWLTVIVSGGLVVTTVIMKQWLYRPANYPPGPIGLPIVGSALTLSNAVHADLNRMADKYGDVFSVNLGGTMYIVLNSHEAIKEAFVTQGANYADRPDSFFNRLIEEDIFSRSFDEQFIQNKKFALQALRLSGFGTQLGVDKIFAEAEKLVSWMAQHGDEPFELTALAQPTFANCIASVLFDRSFARRDDPRLAGLVADVLHFNELFFAVSLYSGAAPAWYVNVMTRGAVARIRQVYASLATFIATIVDEERATFDGAHVRHFLDVYIQGKSHLNESAFIGNITSFLPDSIASTSQLFVWTWLFLLSNPREKQAIVDEIKREVGDRPVKLSDRANLVHLEAFFREVMRCGLLFTLAPNHLTKVETSLRGYTIPAKSIVLANIYSSHFDDKIFPQPHKFDPRRHLEADGKTLRKMDGSVMPFSLGRRMCMGEQLVKMEMFVMTVTLLQRVDLQFDPSSAPPDTQPVADDVVRIAKPFKVTSRAA